MEEYQLILHRKKPGSSNVWLTEVKGQFESDREVSQIARLTIAAMTAIDTGAVNLLERDSAPDLEHDPDRRYMRCNYFIYPYTEANMCVLAPHAGNHRDVQGREFDNVRYVREESSGDQAD